MTSLSPSASLDLDLLLALGARLDHTPPSLEGRTVRQWLISTLLRIRNKHGRLVPLVPNAAQLAYDRNCKSRNIVLKARQLGLTTWIAARYFISAITHPGTVCVQVAHDQRSAEEIFRIVHRFMENLPPFLLEGSCGDGRIARPGALAPSRSNVRQIVFPALDSEYRVESAADSNAGRGLTIHHLHCSEVARWNGGATSHSNFAAMNFGGGEEVLAALRAAVPPDGEIVLESTPNGAGGVFYEEWQRAHETGYQQHFFPWWVESSYMSQRNGAHSEILSEAKDLLSSNFTTMSSSKTDPSLRSGLKYTDDELALIAKHDLTNDQILFRRELRSNFRRLAAQEFAEDPESCFLASGECVFDVDIIERRLREVTPPAETRDNGRLLIWLPPLFETSRRPKEGGIPIAAALYGKAPFESVAGPTAKDQRPTTLSEHSRLDMGPSLRSGCIELTYLVAVDPAGGSTEGDYTCAQVIELRTGLQCAELHGHFTPAETARRVVQLAREYGNAMIAVERNNHGHAVLAHLTSTEHYDNLYVRNGQLGWLTSTVTRPQMLESFAAALTSAPELFSSARLLRECRSFVRRFDGSPAAAPGAHDDCVMAMAIAMAVRGEFCSIPSVARDPYFASAALAR